MIFTITLTAQWIKKTVIPPDRAGVGVFTALADLTNKRTAGIIEEASKAKAPAGSGTAARSPISTTRTWMKRALKPKG